MKNRGALIGLGIIAAGLVFGLIMQPKLPEKLPVHWNASGQVDRYGGQAEALYLMPAISLFLLLLLWALPQLSPKGKDIEAFRPQYDATIVALCALMTAIHVAVLLNAMRSFDVSRVVFGAVCLLFVFIGNLLGKTTRNYWMGIRTPWTLESDAVWEKTHRMAGRWMVGTGLLGFLVGVFTPWPLVSIVLILVGALFPVIYSYFVYRGTTPSDDGSQAPS